jgi:chromosome segregation ATPase
LTSLTVVSGLTHSLIVTVMAEGSETPGGEQPPRSTDRDLLAERRARRAVDSELTHPTDVLIRRAEVAEATVQTLETHLVSLQQRMQEAAEERVLFTERLTAEQAAVAEREHELRRVKQREYAEQQLRVEAEDRRTRLEHDSRAEIDRLTRRLGASEHHARELAERLESIQRELAEDEQVAAAEQVAVRRGERELQIRLSELERRALEIRREIDSERSARERAERQLEDMRGGYQRMELLVAELKGVMAQLRAAATRQSRPQQPEPVVHGEQREELTDALSSAVERLRTRAEASATEPEDLLDAPITRQPSEVEQRSAASPIGPTTVAGAGGLSERTPHKHSMSLLTRLKRRRKQRRERRSAAAEPPTIQSQ